MIEAIQYKAMVQLLGFFAKQLSALSNQLFIQQKGHEPAVVLRARQFIETNKRGRITLATVAKAAGASMFHFCTLFHQTTGLKLSEYIARSRVEDARALLCNRGLRINEVAFEAGFGSVAAFNRAFRRVVGQSPSELSARRRIVTPSNTFRKASPPTSAGGWRYGATVEISLAGLVRPRTKADLF